MTGFTCAVSGIIQKNHPLTIIILLSLNSQFFCTFQTATYLNVTIHGPIRWLPVRPPFTLMPDVGIYIPTPGIKVNGGLTGSHPLGP